MHKRTLRILIPVILVPVLLIALITLFFRFNDILLWNMTCTFRSGIRHSNVAVELLEVENICGKLNGNGNGMNYFGAALVKADSDQVMDALVTKLTEDFETVGYTVITEEPLDISYLEHESIAFDDTELLAGETYYCVYFYVHEHPASNIFDIRGY